MIGPGPTGANGRRAFSRPAGRRAMTVVEILIVMMVSGAVLAALLGLWSGGTKMNKAAQSSVTLQNAMLLQETILQDVRAMGFQHRPPSGRRDDYWFSEKCFSFYKVQFAPDRILLRPIKYSRVDSPGGLYFLARTEIGAGGKREYKIFKQAPLLYLRFAIVEDSASGNRYVKTELAVAENDRRPRQSEYAAFKDRSSAHSLLVRVPYPSMLGGPQIDPCAGKVAPEPGIDLLPLDP